MADLPIQLSFFKKLELYQELKLRNGRIGDDKAWSAEKEILRWAATEHRHLGTGIDASFVENKILKDRGKYSNFPDDALRPMENLQGHGWAEFDGRSLRFLKEGLLMGEVIDDVMRRKRSKLWYQINYVLAWFTTYCGAALIIAPVVRFVILVVCHIVRRWVIPMWPPS
jgi:hypothetical protein